MKKVISFIILSILIISGCSKKGPDQGELAAIAAKGYYDLLLENKYSEFVNGMNQPDSIPAGYREQLETNAKMFVYQQKEEHRGISNVKIADAKVDTARHTAMAFLVLDYGDKTSEEIVVPMIEVKGKWKMQ